MRGLLAMSRGEFEQARAALADAIVVDPLAPHARMHLARLSLDLGDVRRALAETQVVIDAYPHAEHPWDLRVEIAQHVGRMDLALSALDASTRLWPSNPRAWARIGRLVETVNAERAAQAVARARALSPSAAAAERRP
jgi:tetratricopeptide (TPR) repeat protein